MLDDDIIEHYRAEAEVRGVGYQTAINEALRATLDTDNAPLTANKLRQLLREELRQADGERLRFGGEVHRANSSAFCHRQRHWQRRHRQAGH